MGKRKGPAGQALTETSIVMVLFVILTFGIIDAGRLMYNYHAVSFVAREAVRWAVVRGATSGHVATVADVQTYAQSMSMGVPVNVDVSWNPDNQPGSAVVVTVRNDFSSMTPFVPSPIRLASSSRMIISR